MVKGKTVGIDATTLEANAALRSIVRRDTGELRGFLTKLAQASGIETPTRADLARIDRKRKKKGSNDDWTHPHDPDAKITKMKDGRTHLAQGRACRRSETARRRRDRAGRGRGDTTTSRDTLIDAAEQVEAVHPIFGDGIQEVVGDKGITATGRSWISRPSASAAISEPIAVDADGRKPRRPRRGVSQSSTHSRRPRPTAAAAPWRAVERPFAHLHETGGCVAHTPRPHEHPEAAADPHRRFQSGLLMRRLIGVGTPRGLQGRMVAILGALLMLIGEYWQSLTRHWPVLPLSSTRERGSIARDTLVYVSALKTGFTTGC